MVLRMAKKSSYSAKPYTSDSGQAKSSRSTADLPQINNLLPVPIDFPGFMDEIAIGVVILDLDRRIVAMNQTLKALTGFISGDLFGVACAHILRSNVCLQNCPLLEPGEDFSPKCNEGNLINKDRQLVPIRITSAPLKNLAGSIVGFIETVEDIRLLRKPDETEFHAYKFKNIIGRSPEMEKIFQILPSLAQSDSSVLITGETGTGKDLMAEAIHQLSNRAKGPFVKINCGALPETLLESELFGHRKGAFTGAIESRPGRFRLAHNGTLHLTEIGDLPLSLQVKLLTFLDDREVFPIGSGKAVAVDVRIIAATNRNLEQRARDKQFRKDLLFRLNVIRLHLPPLRDRKGDIQLLVDHFLNSLSTQLGKQRPPISREALAILMAYHYPGNVRELKNIVEYAVNICADGGIEQSHLPVYLMESSNGGVSAGAPETASSMTFNAVEDGVPLAHPPQDWPTIEKKMILDALVSASGRKNKAAAALGWARSTLYRKMKHYGIH
jgi:two-component system response regulator AtoC